MVNFNLEDERNLTMLVDFYEFTMSNGYFENGLKDKIVYFDMFFRKNPDKAGFAIVAGLEQVIPNGGYLPKSCSGSFSRQP